MMRLIFLASLAFLTTPLLAQAPIAPVGEPLTYKKVADKELKLWVLKPRDWKKDDQHPAIVLFHGGGFVGGTPSQFNSQAEFLAARGMVCFLVQYRLIGRDKSEIPLVCVQDAKSAMRFVRSRATDFGIDPKRIAAGGGSAGGHLSAFVGLVEGQDDPADDLKVSPKANALLLFNPVLDNGPEGWGHDRLGEKYKDFSPAHNISADDPPAIVFLGTEDKLIPVKTIERFRDNMKKAGVNCEAHFYDAQPHGFFNREPFRTQTIEQAAKFLKELGWLP